MSSSRDAAHVDGDVVVSDPIIYLDLSGLYAPKSTNTRVQGQRILEQELATQQILTTKMLENIESNIRQGIKVAGDSWIIKELREKLSVRQERQAQDVSYKPLSEMDLDNSLKSIESMDKNARGPEAAREAFGADENTKVLVATSDDPTKFKGSNVRAFKCDVGVNLDISWESVGEELNKARQESFVRNVGQAIVIVGRDLGIEQLMGPPLEVELMKKRTTDEYLRSLRSKDGKDKTIAEQIKAQIEERKSAKAQGREGKGKASFGVIFIQATDDSGKPIKNKQGDPILDMIEMRNGKVKNVIINDPDGTRKESGAGIKVKGYQVQDGSTLQQKLDKIIGASVDGTKEFSSKALQADIKLALKDDGSAREIEQNSVREDVGVSASTLKEGVDKTFAAIKEAMVDKGVEVDSGQLPSYMNPDSELSPDLRMTKFGEALNSLGDDLKEGLRQAIEEQNMDPQRPDSVVSIDAGGNVNIDFEKFILELAQIGNEGMMLDVGMAGVVTRTKAHGKELRVKLAAQESDSPDHTISPRTLERDDIQQSRVNEAELADGLSPVLPAGVSSALAVEAKKEGGKINPHRPIGDRIVDDRSGSVPVPVREDGSHLQRPKKATVAKIQPRRGSTNRAGSNS